MLAVFQGITCNGFINVFQVIRYNLNQYYFLYFIPIVFFGSFFYTNFFLTLLKYNISQQFQKNKQI